jgi:hypothetical protein
MRRGEARKVISRRERREERGEKEVERRKRPRRKEEDKGKDLLVS